MKFVIAGAGAVGAYMGAAMARAGLDVTLFARGPQLRAIEERGVRVLSPDGDFEARPKATGDLASIGPADVVLLAVKAHSLPQLAPRLGCLLGPETCVVSLQNGVPWWFTPLGLRSGRTPSRRRLSVRHHPGAALLPSRNWNTAPGSTPPASGTTRWRMWSCHRDRTPTRHSRSTRRCHGTSSRFGATPLRLACEP